MREPGALQHRLEGESWAEVFLRAVQAPTPHWTSAGLASTPGRRLGAPLPAGPGPCCGQLQAWPGASPSFPWEEAEPSGASSIAASPERLLGALLLSCPAAAAVLGAERMPRASSCCYHMHVACFLTWRLFLPRGLGFARPHRGFKGCL